MAEQFIGDYKILGKIGAGGMARVYLAVHKDVPNLKVVLKILSDPSLVDRFRQEADKLALLDGNGNICQIKHFFNHGDDFVIAMEYIDGRTLDDLLKEKGSLPVADSIQIISDVLRTLKFAHDKGIFHRDIKPSNIMIDTRGNVKIIDFGIAKAKTDPSLTIDGGSCGTPTYMPPEQFHPSPDINYALVDVYAVGTTLYRMVAGQLPFMGDNPFTLREAKLSTEPPRPRSLNPDIPKSLEDIILKALAKDPEDRFLSADEMRRAIDAEGGGVKARDLTEVVETPRKPVSAGEPKGRSRAGIYIGAIAIAAAVTAAYFLFFRQAAPRPLPAPALASPGDNSVVATSTPTFEWSSAFQGQAAFVLEYGADSTFVGTIEKTLVVKTSYTVPQVLADGRYFWRVSTSSADGRTSQPSPIFSFTVSAAVTPMEPGKVEATLELTIDPQGDVYIDNKLYARSRSNLSATLDTGRHEIRVVNQRSEEKELSKTVSLAAGEVEKTSFAFTFREEMPGVEYGQVIIGSLPTHGAMVFIDGKPQELRTNNTFDLPVGRHTIKAILDLNGQKVEKDTSVVVTKDSVPRIMIDFEK